jgi:hypothetical protein
MLMILIYWLEAYTTKKNTKLSVIATKETGLEANAEKTKYTVTSRDQNVRTKYQHKDR